MLAKKLNNDEKNNENNTKGMNKLALIMDNNNKTGKKQ